MAHSHQHAHDHGHAHHQGVNSPAVMHRAFAIGIGLNLAFVAIEAYWGWRVNSLGLLADAAHNLSDVAGLVLAWAGAAASRLAPNARYTYGWRRASILAAFANAVLLLVAMGSLGWEAVQRLGSGSAQAVNQGWTMIIVASIGIVVNGLTAWLVGHGREHDANLRGAFLHMVADALVSLGVVVAGLLVLWRGWAWIDPVVSLVVALVIVLGTWRLLRQSLRLLFDGVPEHIDLGRVRSRLLALPGVAQVDDLHVWAMGTTQVALTAHLVVPHRPEDDDAFLRAAIQSLQEHFGIAHITLQVTRRSQGALCATPLPKPEPGRG